MVRFLKSSAWVLGLLAAQVIATQQAAAQVVNVVIQNLQSRTIYVAFTLGAGQQPGSINWGNCSGHVSGNQAALPPQARCSTVVASASGSSRFCAATNAMATPNCYLAQTNHWTMIETTFGAGTTNCYPAQASCVWYDVSLIPPNCTDTLWQSQNYCSNTGGAAYNLPVQLSCPNQPTYTCHGPPGSIYGNSGYPTNCGNPNATCTGNTQNCVNAYFHPMFVPPWNKYQPNAQCPAGSTLQIRFLPGS